MCYSVISRNVYSKRLLTLVPHHYKPIHTASTYLSAYFTMASSIPDYTSPSDSQITNPDIKRIIDFWYRRNPIEWIVAPPGLDNQLKSDFGDLVLKARRNELDSWMGSAPGSLALVVMLDQFSRNLFRGSAEAFSGDAKATAVATKAIAKGFDKQVSVIQASSFYLPLMMQESLISVVASRCLFEALKERCASEEEHEWVQLGIDAAGRHVEKIDRFGRFPTRNSLLGRESTAAEKESLREGQGGSS
jgi:uncharacterized protein (DUF924 family)